MITLMQTADAIFYYPMLVETAKTVRAFCARNGFRYEQYVGVKQGHMPWQSTFNRMYMLKEMVDRDAKGWVLYLDADAFIQDLDFDLATYLEERSHKAAIFAGYSTCDISYDINAGGFAINLSHPMGKALVLDWHRRIAEVAPEVIEAAVHWEHDLGNDQHLLFLVLRHYIEDLGLNETFIFERANQSYVNNGPFITQLLRSMFPSYSERMAALKGRVAEVIGNEKIRSDSEGAGIYMPAHHPKLATSCGLKTSKGISTTGKSGGLMFGPYIRLDAGQYIARIYGEVRLSNTSSRTDFQTDVAVDLGTIVLAAQKCHFDRSKNGMIAETPFALPNDTGNLEVRVVVDPETDLSIHAIQIVPA